MDRKPLSEKHWLVAIFVLYFLFAFVYSVLMPMWEGPDEPAHYVIVINLVRAGFYSNLDYSYEAYQPRGYYYMAAVPIRYLDKIKPSFDDFFLPPANYQNVFHPAPIYLWTHENYRFLLGPYVLRWINILLGGLALWLNWITYRRIVPDKTGLSLSALALTALIPQYLHIMSSIGNDALGTLAGALLFYIAIRITSRLSIFLTFLAIILAVVLPLTTKLTALPLGLALLITLGWQNAVWFQNKKSYILYGALTLLATLGLLFVVSPATIQSTSIQLVWRLFNIQPGALSGSYVISMLSQVIWTYWGKVGSISVGLPFWIVDLLTILGLGGMILGAIALIKSHIPLTRPTAWFVTWLAALLTIGAVLKNGLNTNVTQGRFLFPAIGAISILMMGGWYDILPPRFQRDLPLMIVILMLSTSLALWKLGILPVYFQPFLD